jgi:hypothetical protein
MGARTRASLSPLVDSFSDYHLRPKTETFTQALALGRDETLVGRPGTWICAAAAEVVDFVPRLEKANTRGEARGQKRKKPCGLRVAEHVCTPEKVKSRAGRGALDKNPTGLLGKGVRGSCLSNM